MRATEAGTNKTIIEVESVKNVALFYWQKSRERKRMKEFLNELRSRPGAPGSEQVEAPNERQ
jgi:LDH2 family malate/lactate/ureidoglycolate dehydrogenase